MTHCVRLLPLLAILPSALLHAAEPLTVELSCFGTAARRHGVDENLLMAIAKVESNFESRAIHHNTDGSYDLGVMQINSRHLPRLQARSISEDTLLNRPCKNVDVGAEILAGFVQRFGPTWRAVGAYGAGSRPQMEDARRTYATKVATALARVQPSSVRAAFSAPKQDAAMMVVD